MVVRDKRTSQWRRLQEVASIAAAGLVVLCIARCILIPRQAIALQNTTAPAASEAADPGVVVTFATLRAGMAPATGAGMMADSRVARLLAIYVPKGAAPSPLTPSGPFRATFEGDINLRLRTVLVFSATGKGKLTMKIGDKQVLTLEGDFNGNNSEPLRLVKGKNHFIAVYESPADDDAALRVFWSSATFKPEPLSPAILTHDRNIAGLEASESLAERPVADCRFPLHEMPRRDGSSRVEPVLGLCRANAGTVDGCPVAGGHRRADFPRMDGGMDR